MFNLQPTLLKQRGYGAFGDQPDGPIENGFPQLACAAVMKEMHLEIGGRRAARVKHDAKRDVLAQPNDTRYQCRKEKR